MQGYDESYGESRHKNTHYHIMKAIKVADTAMAGVVLIFLVYSIYSVYLLFSVGY